MGKIKRKRTRQSTAVERIAALRASVVDKPHGTRARYVAGCRCEACTTANTAYGKEVYRRHRAGETNPIVLAETARKHIKKLSKHGVGNRSIAEVSGVRYRTISLIRSGEQLRIRKSAEIAILNVGTDAATGRALIDAKPTLKVLDELVERGYSKAQLARWLGFKHPDLQIRGPRVTAETAAKVRRMVALLDAGKLRRD